jgi:hypothetical protein
MPDLIKNQDIQPPTLIIIGSVVALHDKLKWFPRQKHKNQNPCGWHALSWWHARCCQNGLKGLLNKGFLSPKLRDQFWVNPSLFFNNYKEVAKQFDDIYKLIGV